MTDPSHDPPTEGPAGEPVNELREFITALADREVGRLSPDEIRAQLQERVNKITGGILEVRSGTYRGSVDDDEHVVAEVNGTGKLVNLEISPYAMRDMDAAELGRACGEAIAAARKALSDELRGALARVTGQTPPEELPDPEESRQRAEKRFRDAEAILREAANRRMRQ